MSYIYIIGPENNGPVKIGISKKPTSRLKQLQTAHPEKLIIHNTFEIEESRTKLLEQKIHKDLSYLRSKGEWFNIDPKEAIELVSFFVIKYKDTNENILRNY